MIGFASLFLLLKYSAKQLSFCTVSSQVKLFFFSVVVMGFVSSVMSHRPLWALTALSVLLLSCGIGCAFALHRNVYGAQLDRAFIGLVILICTVKTIQVLSAPTAAFLSP
ncbi:pilus assembly protein, partial [Pseudomonas syringae]